MDISHALHTALDRAEKAEAARDTAHAAGYAQGVQDAMEIAAEWEETHEKRDHERMAPEWAAGLIFRDILALMPAATSTVTDPDGTAYKDAVAIQRLINAGEQP